jgi:hypothetical protein
MVVHTIALVDAEQYYLADMFGTYKQFCKYFEFTSAYDRTPSRFIYKKMIKDGAEKKIFKTYFDKGMFDEYYKMFDEEEEEEEVVEEEKKRLTYIKVDGVSKLVELDEENYKKLKKKEKEEKEVKFVQEKEEEVVEEKKEEVVEESDTDTLSLPEEEIDMNYPPSDAPYVDPSLLITEQPLTKKEMTIECDFIVKSIVEDAIKNGKEVKSPDDDEKKKCENCVNYEMNCMLFEDKYYMCKECYDDVDVGRFYMKRYFELMEEIYHRSKIVVEGMKAENKIVEITDKGKKKTKYKKAKCDGHNPTKSNDNVFNPLLCKCRIWNEGYGGQCQSNKNGEEDMCKTHFKKVKKLREDCNSDTIGWWFGNFDDEKENDIIDLYCEDDFDIYMNYLPKTVKNGAMYRGNSGGSEFKWK